MRQLKTKLSHTKKEGPVSSYLLEIKKRVDALILVGGTLEDVDHAQVILEGLTKEYAPFITAIALREKPISVGDSKALLMAQEEWIEKFKKKKVLFRLM